MYDVVVVISIERVYELDRFCNVIAFSFENEMWVILWNYRFNITLVFRFFYN
jgi:hypothetical protein